MASTKRKNSKSTGNAKSGTARKTSGRKPARVKAKASPTPQSSRPGRNPRNPLMDEVMSLIAIAIGIFLLLAIFTDNGVGVIGQTFRSVFLGMFGFGACLIPFFVIALGIYILFQKAPAFPLSKFLLGTGFFFCLIALVSLSSQKEALTYGTFSALITASYNAGALTNGGVMGEIISRLLRNTIGIAGAYLLLITFGGATLTLLTGKSFFNALARLFDQIKDILAVSETDMDEYTDEEFYDEYDEYDESIEDGAYSQLHRNEPKPAERKPQNGSKPPKKGNPAPTFIIEDRAKDQENKKVLLIHETSRKPVPKTVLDFTPKRPEDALTHPVIGNNYEEPEIKGLPPEESAALAASAFAAANQGDGLQASLGGGSAQTDNAADHKDRLMNDDYPDYPEEVFINTAFTSGPLTAGLTPSEDYLDKGAPEVAAALTETETLADDTWDTPVGVPPAFGVPAGGGGEQPPVQSAFQRPNTAPAPPRQVTYPGAPGAPSPSGVSGRMSGIPPIEIVKERKRKPYMYPPLDLLEKNPNTGGLGSRAQILENSRKLEETLRSFGVEAKVIEVSKGPTVTRYELSPGQGVKVSKISGLADDLALNLAAEGIRIEAPIPGKSAVGIEVPNKEIQPVYLREVIEDEKFKSYPSKLGFALGKDIAGNTVVTDIAKMPHLLIAGATGSGKSVCINTLVTSILYKASPDDVKLLMVDPKVVELSVYNGIPHLLIPVVTDPKKAAGALHWAVQEMLTRYNLFAETGVRDLKSYNANRKEHGETEFLPQIVIIVDELADLMMAAPGDVEDAICRLAQMARAAGLHLIIATQRPSVDVITGLIKANIPSRLAFAVSSGTDSRTVLDMVGAEKLLGKGDMLFCPVGLGKPLRVQGAYVSDKEVENIVTFLKNNADTEYDQSMIDTITAAKRADALDNGEVDEVFDKAIVFLIEKEKASASMLQRQFRIGYNRASRLIEDLEARGLVGPEDGSKPRKVLVTRAQWEQMKSEGL